jgi:hypothetical protein
LKSKSTKAHQSAHQSAGSIRFDGEGARFDVALNRFEGFDAGRRQTEWIEAFRSHL